jgi:hypothetical protein
VTTLRALAFGDVGAGSWGVAWTPAQDTAISLAGAVDSVAGLVTGELNGAGEGEAWRLDGNGTSLLFTPTGPPGHADASDGALSSLNQLCTVSGTVMLEGNEREIASMGWRMTLEGKLELDRIDSFRQTSAWFEPHQGFSLVALRPRKSRGQDADLVAAVVLEPEETPPVADPRLSTTYNAAGFPARAGLELWFEEDNGDQDQANRHYLRRAAGEAVGAGLDWVVAGFQLYAALLRWHSRGVDGTGIYLLGRRQ